MTIAADFRFARRGLCRRPLFSLLVMAVLGLGLGAGVSVFSLAHSLFFQRLPFPGAERLVSLHETRGGAGHHPSSWPNYDDYRARVSAFEDLVAHYSGAPIRLATPTTRETTLVNGGVVSEGFFAFLGIRPALGRLFEPDEHRDHAPVVVLGHAFWQRRFGGDTSVIGTELEINGEWVEVIGVTERGFRGAQVGRSMDLWMPRSLAGIAYRWCEADDRDCTYLDILGRRRHGVSLATARTELEHLALDLEHAHPEANRDKGIAAVPATGVEPGAQASVAATRLLALIVAVVLVATCANLAGLIAARNGGRSGELSIRVALGAGRWPVLRLLLAESLLLATGGAAVGLLVAMALRLLWIGFFDFERGWMSSGVAPPVLLFTSGLALTVGLAFGLAPAWLATRSTTVAALRCSITPDRRRTRLRVALVVAQVAVCLALVIASGLLFRSHSTILESGAAEQTISFRARPNLLGYDREAALRYHRGLLEGLRAFSEIRAVGLAQGLPHGLYGPPRSVSLPGLPVDIAGDLTAVYNDAVSAGFFAAADLPILRGRDFDERDQPHAALVVVVNRALARRLWPEKSPVGETMIVDGKPHEVIGLVPNAHPASVDRAPRPYFYRSFWQAPEPMVDARYLASASLSTSTLADLVRGRAAEVDARVPIVEVATLQEKRERTFLSVRLALTVASLAGGLVLLLTSVGLYGVLALLVVERRREIGLRLAVGATRTDVLHLIVRRVFSWCALGTLLGLLLAAALSRALAGFLYGVAPFERGAYAAGVLLLALVSLLAVWRPARAATRIDPATALRSE